MTLERATPPVKIRKPSKDTQQPTPVIELRKFLTEGFDKAIIPKGLEVSDAVSAHLFCIY